ncbi:MAG: hypothetical protein COW08_06995 [Ignavibacteriales bacterium CG12_big_fil_rev_8_21_14_0_65_30_8]|nr:MAG: hypothetical protein COW08_06995 [Ignavibacteriales bacterium CG12_big_fil_rev_8_21_14_0_65_30_8]
MECLKCYNDMYLHYVELKIEREDYNLELKKIPGYVCTECKETYIEEDEMSKIFETVEGLDKNINNIKQKKL